MRGFVVTVMSGTPLMHDGFDFWWTGLLFTLYVVKTIEESRFIQWWWFRS